MKNPFKRKLSYTAMLGFALIFISIDLFGKTEFLSWEMFMQTVMVSVGGILITISGAYT